MDLAFKQSAGVQTKHLEPGGGKRVVEVGNGLPTDTILPGPSTEDANRSESIHNVIRGFSPLNPASEEVGLKQTANALRRDSRAFPISASTDGFLRVLMRWS